MATTSTKTSSNLMSTHGALGLHPLAPIEEEHDYAEHSDLWWPRIRMSLKEPLAEFFGVFILALFGDGAVAQVLLSAGQNNAPGGDGFGTCNNINGINYVERHGIRTVPPSPTAALIKLLRCSFGGILYDLFIYTATSPINTPYLGFEKFLKPKSAVKERVGEQKKDGLV